jgi:hypothetical protein
MFVTHEAAAQNDVTIAVPLSNASNVISTQH